MDALLYHTPDGGEINATNGTVEMSDGLAGAAYLSLFGGNEQDSGSDSDKSKQWWANFIEPDTERHYRSEFQNLIRSLPAVPMNLRRLEEAATSDLAWMTNSIASAVSATARIPALNTVELSVKIDIDGRTTTFVLSMPWQKQ